METSLTIDYDKQWLNCVSAIDPVSLIMFPIFFFEGHRFLTSVNEHTILDYTVFVVNQKFRFGKKAAGTRVHL